MATRQGRRRKPKIERGTGESSRVAKALSHPLRARILARLNEEVASPADLAREIGMPVANVAYHVKMLAELDCIELVSTRPRRGAVEHFYRATRRLEFEDETWSDLPDDARRGIVNDWFRVAFTGVTRAIDEGKFEERDDVHFSTTNLELSEESWTRITARLREVLEEAMELQAEDMSNDDAATIRSQLVMMLHPRADPPSPRAQAGKK